MTPAWKYLLWDTAKVTISGHTPGLAASLLVLVPCPVMYSSIFPLWSSIITNPDFSAVQSAILSTSVIVGGSCSSWLPNTCISLADIKELDLEKAHEPQHPSPAKSMEEDQLF